MKGRIFETRCVRNFRDFLHSCFVTIPACDGRTDGHGKPTTVSCSAYLCAILEEARDKNGINVGNKNERKRPENMNICIAV